MQQSFRASHSDVPIPVSTTARTVPPSFPASDHSINNKIIAKSTKVKPSALEGKLTLISKTNVTDLTHGVNSKGNEKRKNCELGSSVSWLDAGKKQKMQAKTVSSDSDSRNSDPASEVEVEVASVRGAVGKKKTGKEARMSPNREPNWERTPPPPEGSSLPCQDYMSCPSPSKQFTMAALPQMPSPSEQPAAACERVRSPPWDSWPFESRQSEYSDEELAHRKAKGDRVIAAHLADRKRLRQKLIDKGIFFI